MRFKTFGLKATQYLTLSALLLAFLCYCLVKILNSINLFSPQSGNDSDYYHQVALGNIDNIVNGWSYFLLFLSNLGLYSRFWISLSLLAVYFLVSFCAPNLALLGIYRESKKLLPIKRAQWTLRLLLICYPSLFVFSLDIYRDLIMVLVTLLMLPAAYVLANHNPLKRRLFPALYYVLGCIVLFKLRPYLGVSASVAILLPNAFLHRRFFVTIALGVTVLMALYYTGYIEPLLAYRGESGFEVGASSFNLSFIGLSPISFLYTFFLSYIFQIFGLYITNFKSLTIFIVETLPFILAAIYIYCNRCLFDRFCTYLLSFFLIYSSVFAIGNDNLGTALRLRLIPYITIYILALRLFSLRRLAILRLQSS